MGEMTADRRNRILSDTKQLLLGIMQTDASHKAHARHVYRELTDLQNDLEDGWPIPLDDAISTEPEALR